MMTTRLIKTYILGLAAAFAAGAAAKQPAGVTNLRVAAVSVVPMPNEGKMLVSMTIDPRDIHPGRDREVTFTPVVRSLNSADSLELSQLKVCGRNRYYSHLRNGDLADGDKILEAGHGKPESYSQVVPWQEWMLHSRIDVRESVAHCCDAPQYLTRTPVADIDYSPRLAQLPTGYVALTGDSLITRELSGNALIIFRLDKTSLDSTYKTNPVELGKIYASIDTVAGDPDAEITSIFLKGFASPEGTYKHNVELAMGRTNTIRDLVRKRYQFANGIINTDHEPENWEGLIDWLQTHSIDNGAEILAIASDSSIDPDPRDALIRQRYPKQYKFLRDSVYPWLRMTQYKVNYRYKAFDSVDKLKEIFASDPSKLRPIDFTRIAATYPEGSEEYDSVYVTAVQVWPADPLANLNMANILLKRSDSLQGQQREQLLNRIDRDYLSHAGMSAEAYYTRGALAARRGDLNLAVRYLDDAAAAGLQVAADDKQQLLELIQRPYVDYGVMPRGIYTGKNQPGSAE